ncbi:MAG TPA: S8 family serine peptidase [Ignavibacteriaceae bacterium]|nr:S8 family serine peptidase [Ignavibacteriaceae bacterium]
MNKFSTSLILSICLAFNSFILPQEDEFIPGELIIQFKEKVSMDTFEQSYVDIEMESIRLLSDRMNIWWVKYNSEENDDAEVRFRVSRDARVSIVQFNHRVTLRESFDEFSSQFANFPDDPQFVNQWGLHNTGQSGGTPDADIDAPEAWDIITGGVTVHGDTIVVAIVDGGCQLNHPDLTYWYNWNEIPGNGIDDDGNGYIDDFRGWNAYNNSPNVPSNSHGTHVSGISGAKGNNNLGVSGVNWNVKVLPIAGSSSSEATVVAAYAYALELRAQYNETNGALGAFIVATNSSFGVDYGQPANYPIWCAMYDSLGVHGILSCGATANLNINIDVTGDVPTSCSSDYMIAVTNTTRFDLKNSGAAYGLTTIDLGAPGTSILSTDVNSTYTNKTGTSMATPMVTGAIALMYAAADISRLSFYKSNLATGTLMFRDVLFNGVDSISALQGITVTGGRLNVFNAVVEISSPIVPVELVSFNHELFDGSVNLSWITATEINNQGFEIERTRLRSSNYAEASWATIGFVPGFGTTTEPKSYSFIEKEISAGTYNYRLKQIDFGGSFEYSFIIEVEVGAPNQFSLEQNYPNPFNPSTKIKFTVPNSPLSLGEGQGVRLIVYDVLGNEVATLVNEELPAGEYEVDFHSNNNSDQSFRLVRNLSSGVYFYKLTAGTFSETKKMILAK